MGGCFYSNSGIYLYLGYLKMKIATTEAEHQKAVIKWANDQVKFQPKKYWMLKYLYAVPNEGQHKPQYRKHQKAMGLKAGVLDLWLPYPIYNPPDYSPPDVRWHGLIIEMKSKDTKGKVSPDQKEWIDYLSGQGYKVEVCWSAQEAIKVLEDYLK